MRSFLIGLSILLLFSVMLAGAQAASTSALVLTDQDHTFSLSGHSRYFRDDSLSMTLDQFLALDPAALTPTTRVNKVLGISDSPYWFRVTLDNQSAQRNWLFTARYFGNGLAEVYLQDAVGQWRQVASMDRLQDKHFVAPLPLAPQARQELVIRSISPGPDKFGFFVVDQAGEQHFAMWENRWLGIFYGGLCTLVLYNFFVALSMRSITYGFYVVYLLSMVAFLFVLDGFGMIYFWGDSVEWSMSSYYMFVAILVLAGCQFARLFLDTSQCQPRMDWALKALMLIAALFVVLEAVLVHQPWLVAIAMLLASVYAIVIFSAGLMAYLNGNRMARYFLVAWIFPEIGILYSTAMYAGVMPFNGFGFNIVHATTLIEAILLSMALADRINILREERENAVMASRNRLQVANQELARANDLKDAFLATISHELRTPMNGVIGSLELLKQRQLPSEDRALLSTMGSSSETMLSMVERILRFSELQSGSATLTPKAVHLPSWLQQVTRRWETRCKEKGLQWHCDMQAAHLTGVVMDEVKAGQLLDELLANAVKFTAQGKVSLAVSVREAHRIAFRVEDDGVGIPDAQRAEIFASFHQVQSSFNRQFGGLGIGLTLARELAHLLGGELDLCDTQGKGACFVCEIPFQPARLEEVSVAEKTLPDDKPAALEAERPLHILIVEDNNVNQLVMKKIVTSLGHQFTLAADGVEAVHAAQQQRYDLILMDCQMPNMDGFDATRCIRQECPLNQATPIVAVTANAMEGDRQRCLDAGMNDYVKKPVKPVMIKQVIAQWVLDQDKDSAHSQAG